MRSSVSRGLRAIRAAVVLSGLLLLSTMPALGQAAGKAAPGDQGVREIRSLLSQRKYAEVVKRCDAALKTGKSPRLQFFKDIAERRLDPERTLPDFVRARSDALAKKLRSLEAQPYQMDTAPVITEERINNPPPVTYSPVSMTSSSSSIKDKAVNTYKDNKNIVLGAAGGAVGLIVLVVVVGAIRSRRRAQEEDEEEEEYEEEDEEELDSSDLGGGGMMGIDSPLDEPSGDLDLSPELSGPPEPLDLDVSEPSIPDSADIDSTPSESEPPIETIAVGDVETLESPEATGNEPETLTTPGAGAFDISEHSAPELSESEPSLDLDLDFLADSSVSTASGEAEAPSEPEPEPEAPVAESDEISFDDLGIGDDLAPTDEPVDSEGDTAVVGVVGSDEGELDLENVVSEPETQTEQPVDDTVDNFEPTELEMSIPEATPAPADLALPEADTAGGESSPFDDLSLEETVLSLPGGDPSDPGASGVEPGADATEDLTALDEQLAETLPTEQTDDSTIAFTFNEGLEESAPGDAASDEDIATEEQNMFLEQIRKGDAAAEEGNWKMAAHHFNVATAIDPESTMAFDKLAQANEKVGE